MYLCGDGHSCGGLGGNVAVWVYAVCVEWVCISVCEEELGVVMCTVILASIC